MLSEGALARFGVLFNAEYEHRWLMRLAALAEDLGFGTFWYADERFYRETYTGLAAAALATSRILLGTAVTDPYTRHPALTAAGIASLDELAAGRAVLGYGAGRSGFDELGIQLTHPAATLREAIEIIRRLLAGERVTYRGEQCSLSDGGMRFPTRSDLPVYLAADGQHTLRLAGAIADGVIVAHCASALILRSRLEHVEVGRQAVGRSVGPVVVARVDVTLSHDHAAALQHAKLRMGRVLWSHYPTIPYLAQHGLVLPAELDRRFREAGPFERTHDLEAFRRFVDAIPDELVTPIALAGTPAEVGAQLRSMRAAGADGFMCWLQVPPTETIEHVMQLYAEAATIAQA